MQRGIFRHRKVSFTLASLITFRKPITSENVALDYSAFAEKEPDAE